MAGKAANELRKSNGYFTDILSVTEKNSGKWYMKQFMTLSWEVLVCNWQLSSAHSGTTPAHRSSYLTCVWLAGVALTKVFTFFLNIQRTLIAYKPAFLGTYIKPGLWNRSIARTPLGWFCNCGIPYQHLTWLEVTLKQKSGIWLCQPTPN